MIPPVTSTVVTSRGGQHVARMRRLLLAQVAASCVTALAVAAGASWWWLLLTLPSPLAGGWLLAGAARRHRRALAHRPRYGVVRASDGSQIPLVFICSAEDPLVFVGRQAGSELPLRYDPALSYEVEIDVLGPGQTVHVAWVR